MITMARAPLLWLMLSLVDIVLVTCGQYQKIPEDYLQPTGNASQMVTIQLVICSPGQPEGQTACQGLYLVSNCSLQINQTMTELFFTNTTNTTNNDGDDSDDSYRTLLDFAAINNSIKILPNFQFISDLLLKGAFIFDLKCTSPDAEKVTEDPSIVTTESNDATSPERKALEEEIYWIIVGILAVFCLVLSGFLFYQYKRYKVESSKSLPSTYCRSTHAREEKELWQLDTQNENGRMFQSTDQLDKNKQGKRCSWRLRMKSKKVKHKNPSYVNTEVDQTKEQVVNGDPSRISIESHSDYLPMDQHPKNTSASMPPKRNQNDHTCSSQPIFCS